MLSQGQVERGLGNRVHVPQDSEEYAAALQENPEGRICRVLLMCGSDQRAALIVPARSTVFQLGFCPYINTPTR